MNVQLTANQRKGIQILQGRIPATNAYSGIGPLIGVEGRSSTFKHDIEYDFGYPRSTELGFTNFHNMWKRRGIAHGLVGKTANKTWQEAPVIVEDPEEHKETNLEKAIRTHLQKIRFWQQMQETDLRSMVGKYSALIFRLGDGKAFDQPVERVPGKIKGLLSVIPAWEGQLQPADWDNNSESPTYGQPLMYTFNESKVDAKDGSTRSFSVHPDRVLIWSRDGTVFGDSKLEPCYNALMDVDKIRGGGAEGFWKNAKAQPVLTATEEVDFNQLASMLGTDLEGLPDALDGVVRRWSKGFDESLMLQGMKAETLSVTMIQPEQFFNIAVQEISASWPIPQKVLTGMQTGERASTEDSKEWAQINANRRNAIVIPNIMDALDRFVSWGMIPDQDWHVSWADLTAPTIVQKMEISEKMAKVNQAMFATGEAVFTDDEIRAAAGYDPMEVADFSEPDDMLEEDVDG
jgi:hypothetical protein